MYFTGWSPFRCPSQGLFHALLPFANPEAQASSTHPCPPKNVFHGQCWALGCIDRPSRPGSVPGASEGPSALEAARSCHDHSLRKVPELGEAGDTSLEVAGHIALYHRLGTAGDAPGKGCGDPVGKLRPEGGGAASEPPVPGSAEACLWVADPGLGLVGGHCSPVSRMQDPSAGPRCRTPVQVEQVPAGTQGRSPSHPPSQSAGVMSPLS